MEMGKKCQIRIEIKNIFILFQDKSESPLKVWEKVESSVWKLLNCMERKSTRTALEGIEPGISPWFDFLLSSIGDRTEPVLVKFFKNLLNLKVESEFFLSGFYRQGEA